MKLYRRLQAGALVVGLVGISVLLYRFHGDYLARLASLIAVYATLTVVVAYYFHNRSTGRDATFFVVRVTAESEPVTAWAIDVVVASVQLLFLVLACVMPTSQVP